MKLMRNRAYLLGGLVVVAIAAVFLVVWRSDPPGPSEPMQRLTGVWIEGPGDEITYGGSYEGCTRLCLDKPRCRMVEFYTPEKKCNLYDEIRPRIKGGSSIVGMKRP